MIVGSFAKRNNGSLKGLVPGAYGLTWNNYSAIDKAVDLGTSLLNSAIFTGGVLVCTLFFGTLAGYALARLRFPGRGVMFALMLLLQTIPFQLLIIPIYVLIARDYGLSDNYIGMIAPFAINSTAVFVFRQYFLQLPAGAVRGGAHRRGERVAGAVERGRADGAPGAASPARC